MPVLFALAGVLLDLLLELGVAMTSAALVGAAIRGAALDDWPGMLVLLALAGGGLFVLVRRIVRGRRTLYIHRAGSEEVGTVTWLHFVCDGLCIVTAIAMVRGATPPVWDDASRAAAVAVLVVCAGLAVLRAVVRVRGER